MTVQAVLHDLQAKDIKLAVRDNRLAVDAPKGVMTAELQEIIREHKDELIAALSSSLPHPRHAGGFPITDAEHPCPLCGGADWQQHVTYKYCLTCGEEAGPGAVADEREEAAHE